MNGKVPGLTGVQSGMNGKQPGMSMSSSVPMHLPGGGKFSATQGSVSHPLKGKKLPMW